MAAAYAALVSLTNVLHQILHPPPCHHFIIPEEQIESLSEKVYLLIDFLENYSSICCSKEYENLVRWIADAAYDAEDLIETEVVRQIRAKSAACGEKLVYHGIKKAMVKLHSFEKKLVKIKERKGLKNLQHEISIATTSSRHKNVMVGFDEHLIQIMSAIASDESNRQIIPIVGMGGIGKTTLATNVYNNPLIIEHFHVRAWITISQDYTVGELLLKLLHQISNPNGHMRMQSDDQIGLLLHKELFYRKYLVVMDDIWSIQAWDKIKMFFPNNYNGSRILVTTRLSNLVADFGSCRPYKMGLLDEKQSWNLLRERVLSNEHCPRELEEIGKRISERCGGLPLALVVIGGILAKSKRTREHWEYVEENVISALNYEDDEHCMKMLSLSYNHLPIHLKPCFLYLAMFPEDFEINVSKLVRLWVAEGFIKPTTGKSLEEIARANLDHLLDRNLILVGKWGSSGKVKTIIMHDLLRDLCWRKAHQDKFLCVANLDNPNISPYLKEERRLCIYFSWKRRKEVCKALRSATLCRSLLSNFEWNSEWTFRSFSLLRVLDVVDRYPIHEIVKLVNSRYVTCSLYWDYLSEDTHPSLLPLWNLQTFVSYEYGPMPLHGVWQMPQLRHLKIRELRIGRPIDGQDFIVLENLQTLSTVKHFSCTEEIVKRIPNVKKLGIAYDSSSDIWGPYFLTNLVHLHKLESLGITGDQILWGAILFPPSLKKLVLIDCKIRWEDMSMIGSLPNLEVLKLWRGAKGTEWNPVEEEFSRLKYLSICRCELKIWGVEDTHFPSLEHLTLEDVAMKEIPMSVAEIQTLQVIEIHRIHESFRTAPYLLTSAKEISAERGSFGYEPLTIIYIL